MPRFIYEGDGGRYYPTLGLTPEPGGSYNLDTDPGDGRWTAAAPAKKAAKAAAATPDGD